MTLQIKIALDRIRPPIWRRLLVRDDSTFARLHDIIQSVMGWENGHLHGFEVENMRIGPQSGYVDSAYDEMKIRLHELLRREVSRFRYTYDFGDYWTHTLEVEKVLPPEKGVKYPLCLKGKRACPPEDCGGPWGYANLLQAQEHPSKPQHAELLEWAGDFDPEAFDLEGANARLEWLR